MQPATPWNMARSTRKPAPIGVTGPKAPSVYTQQLDQSPYALGLLWALRPTRLLTGRKYPVRVKYPAKGKVPRKGCAGSQKGL